MKELKSLGYQLGRTLRVFKNQMASEFREQEIDLTVDQFIILRMLYLNCDLIQQDLANQLQKDKSSIVRQINELLKCQYLVRHTNREDKRKKNLTITKNGMEILNQMTKIALEVSGKLLSGVAEQDLDIFEGVLLKIQQNGETTNHSNG